MLFLKKIVVSTDGDQSREASDNITRKKNKLFRCIMLTHLRFVHANVGTCAIKNDERGNYFFFSLTVVCVTPINVTSTNRVSLSLLMGISAYGIGSPALCRRGGKDLCITSFITSHVYNMYIGRKWVYLFLFILLGIFLSSLWIKTNLLWRSEGGIYNNNVLIKLGECYGFFFEFRVNIPNDCPKPIGCFNFLKFYFYHVLCFTFQVSIFANDFYWPCHPDVINKLTQSRTHARLSDNFLSLNSIARKIIIFFFWITFISHISFDFCRRENYFPSKFPGVNDVIATSFIDFQLASYFDIHRSTPRFL